MRLAVAIAAATLLCGCDRQPAATADTGRDAAMAAAERQAIGDTDGALRDARADPAPGTKASDDRFPR